MGKASRGKVERRRLREAQAAEAAAARQAQASVERDPGGLASFFTADGPPSDFPTHAGLGILLLLVLVAVAYYPALMAGFIWDDVIFTSAKPVLEWSGIWDIWSDPRSLKLEGHYWPVVYTSFWLEHKLWGLDPVGYHATNILLQGINTLLVWRLMLRLTVPGAWLIAAVFAVHPLHVESVAWVIERKDLLSGVFYLSAALAWLRFMEASRFRHYFAALGLFAASLLSKTVTVTFPAAVLVLIWWKRGRVTVRDGLWLLPFFAVGFAFAFGDTAYYASREPLDLAYSFAERLQIAAHALWFYVGKLLWPVDLAVIYPFWEVGAGRLVEWGYVVAAAVVLAGLWRARQRIGRGPLAAALFYGVTLSPVLGFVDFGYMQFSFVADRFQYLAGIGVMGALIGAGVHAAGRFPAAARKGALGVALLGIAVLTALSWKQSHIYRDEITFFRHIVAHNPQGRDAYHNLGKALQDVGRMEEALEAARIAVEYRPDFAGAYGNLGLALKHFGRLEEAEEVLRRGVEADPKNKNVLLNLGEVIRQQGRHEESLQWYDAVLRRDREYALAYAGKGDALFVLGRHEEAVSNLKKALALTPDMPQAPLMNVLLGDAARELERFGEAERQYRNALRIEPGLFRAHTSLAGLLIDRGRADEADRHLQSVRVQYPDHADGLQEIAEFFRKREQYEEALGWYDAVFEADRDYTQAYAGKGDALFRLGRYEEAIESLGRAIALEPGMSTVPALRVLIGEAHQKLGRLEEALAQYELILAGDSNNSSAIDRLAMVRYEQGRLEESLELYRRHIRLDPGNANAHSNLGVVLYRMGRIGEAREALEHALSLDPSAGMARTVLDLIAKGE